MRKSMRVNHGVSMIGNLFLMLPLLFLFSCALDKNEKPVANVGGWAEASAADELPRNAAEFAVKAKQEVMRKAESQKAATIKLVKIISVKQQVVAGMNYDLKLQVDVDGASKTAHTVVWHKLSGDFQLTSWNWE